MALGYCWLLCWVDRRIIAPLFGYKGLAYRSVPTQTQICVLGLINTCTVITPTRYRQPSDGVLYVLLFTCLLMNEMLLALVFVMQWPGMVQRADKTLRAHAGHGHSGFVELTSR